MTPSGSMRLGPGVCNYRFAGVVERVAECTRQRVSLMSSPTSRASLTAASVGRATSPPRPQLACRPRLRPSTSAIAKAATVSPPDRRTTAGQAPSSQAQPAKVPPTDEPT